MVGRSFSSFFLLLLGLGVPRGAVAVRWSAGARRSGATDSQPLPLQPVEGSDASLAGRGLSGRPLRFFAGPTAPGAVSNAGAAFGVVPPGVPLPGQDAALLAAGLLARRSGAPLALGATTAIAPALPSPPLQPASYAPALASVSPAAVPSPAVSGPRVLTTPTAARRSPPAVGLLSLAANVEPAAGAVDPLSTLPAAAPSPAADAPAGVANSGVGFPAPVQAVVAVPPALAVQVMGSAAPALPAAPPAPATLSPVSAVGAPAVHPIVGAPAVHPIVGAPAPLGVAAPAAQAPEAASAASSGGVGSASLAPAESVAPSGGVVGGAAVPVGAPMAPATAGAQGGAGLPSTHAQFPPAVGAPAPSAPLAGAAPPARVQSAGAASTAARAAADPALLGGATAAGTSHAQEHTEGKGDGGGKPPADQYLSARAATAVTPIDGAAVPPRPTLDGLESEETCFNRCSCVPVVVGCFLAFFTCGICVLVAAVFMSRVFSKGFFSAMFFRGGGFAILLAAVLGAVVGGLVGGLVRGCWPGGLYFGGGLMAFSVSIVLLGKRGAGVGAIGGLCTGGSIGGLISPGALPISLGCLVGVLMGIVIGFAPIFRELKMNSRYIRYGLESRQQSAAFGAGPNASRSESFATRNRIPYRMFSTPLKGASLRSSGSIGSGSDPESRRADSLPERNATNAQL
ncbi:hypothetical protein BESB_080830 [Besnoitia besnoiti]|uniref:Uncharacterized protein n=1 Tax=Besnoitia besnoiti TaxID=94643 RepID=A0A2A9ME13_BESBE|nr:hypothetical protein BESB_080830 [Besnoitia besnoiti]PFH33867.1 hypothetical protein BESB_080830 [Besnoitia besnoiti]